MPAKKISFGPIHFDRKRDAEEFLKAMLDRYDVGDRVGAKDSQVLLDAIALHPDFAAKVGCGISYFSVRSADFGTKCFWVNRSDGTTEKFSYRTCIYG